MALILKNESGRSMIEMIAVIAIIGFLSMGGFVEYKNVMAKMRLNDLLSEVRKRALVSDRSHNRFTRDIFDKRSGGVSGLTAYGYAVGDNQAGEGQVKREAVRGHAAARVPVGKFSDRGEVLPVSVCEALLKSVDRGENPKIGAVLEVYDGKCKKPLTKCATLDVDGNETSSVPDIICIAIKS